MSMTGKNESFGDWIVNDDSMEHPANGYFIIKADLPRMKTGRVSEWALHVTEKAWCDPETFTPTLKRAIERHGFAEAVDRPATVDGLRLAAHGRACVDEAERRLGPDASSSAVRELAGALTDCGWFRPSARDLKAREKHRRRAQVEQHAREDA